LPLEAASEAELLLDLLPDEQDQEHRDSYEHGHQQPEAQPRAPRIPAVLEPCPAAGSLESICPRERGLVERRILLGP
jgi:hypothetical protein